MCKNFVYFTGFCSNGEYNTMRSQGYTRPLSVLKIRSNVRSKYARMSKQRMLAMLTPKCEIFDIVSIWYNYITIIIHVYCSDYQWTNSGNGTKPSCGGGSACGDFIVAWSGN